MQPRNVWQLQVLQSYDKVTSPEFIKNLVAGERLCVKFHQIPLECYAFCSMFWAHTDHKLEATGYKEINVDVPRSS